MHCESVCVCVYVGAAPSAALFINTSVGLTVHSGRGREPQDSLGQRPHKKSLLIYFPPNWKVHAHTWLNHHASTGDGPPLHADETWPQFCRAGPSQVWQRKHSVTLHTYTLLNGFCRCATPDSPVPTHLSCLLRACGALSNFSFQLFFFFGACVALTCPLCSFPSTFHPFVLFPRSIRHFISAWLFVMFFLLCPICHSATRSEPSLSLFLSISLYLSF